MALKKLSLQRFNALAGYARQPLLALMSIEIFWYATEGEEVLATVLRDNTDQDYAVVCFCRDLQERFRFAAMSEFKPSLAEAQAEVQKKLKEVLDNLEEERVQGDEKGPPVDFFTLVKPKGRHHDKFLQLCEDPLYSPAKDIIEPMMRWNPDTDGNYVEQFQSVAFGQRLWELYLFAVVVEANMVVLKEHAVPDVYAKGLFGEVSIEATTVNPSIGKDQMVIPPPPVDTKAEQQAYVRHYMPIKFAGPLTAKLKKKYWTHEHVRGKPLIFAIQDFPDYERQILSADALYSYLYGVYFEGAESEPEKIDSHQWGDKAPVASGFFTLPESEHVSAVLYNPHASIEKFVRMGIFAGFGSTAVRATREATIWRNSASGGDLQKVKAFVGSKGYQERWIDGMVVYHNPRALIPLDLNIFAGAAQHYHLENEGIVFTPPPVLFVQERTMLTLA